MLEQVNTLAGGLEAAPQPEAERGEPESAAPKCPVCSTNNLTLVYLGSASESYGFCHNPECAEPHITHPVAKFFPTPALPSVEELARELWTLKNPHSVWKWEELLSHQRGSLIVEAEKWLAAIRSLREKGQQ